ncbi:MAG: hypothetical protein ABSG01_11160 [Anaerolineales bacterium]|jgi:hypothetical protein
METTRQFNPDLGAADWSAILIDKVHRCSDCPIRQLAIKQPHSIFARIHMWHKTWWPGWRAHQARTCSFAATAGTHA